MKGVKRSQLCPQIVDMGLSLIEAGLVTGTAGNVSARTPGESIAFITPSGRDYHLLTERDIVRIDIVSGAAHGRWKPSSEWRLHTAIYRKRSDVNAIIHHHAVWASSVATAHKTIPVLIDEAADIGPISTAPYAPSGSPELADVVSEALTQGTNAVLLANHGAVAVGRDLREAFRRALDVERLSKIYIAATLLGGAHPLDEAAVTRSQEFLAAYRSEFRDHHSSPVTAPRIVGPVSLQDLVRYSFRSGMTFASLLYTLVLQRLQR